MASAPKPIIDNLESLNSYQQRELGQLAIASDFAAEPDLQADGDYTTAINFLLSYDGSTATFNAYRREIERLLQWSWLIHKKSARKLTRDDISEFVRFAINPPHSWIGTKNVPRFIDKGGERKPNGVWRPFVVSVRKSDTRAGAKPDINSYTPSQASLQATFAILSSYYDYLVQEMIIDANPVAMIRQKSKFLRKEHNQAVVRRISDLQWDYVVETAEKMAGQNPAEHERTLFIVTALYAMYLRISELVADERAAPTMGDFKKDRDGNWWFHVTGKGNKHRTVSVSNAMLGALQRYRKSRSLPQLPPTNDPAPLIEKTRGKGAVTSSRHIRKIVQNVFDNSYSRMHEDGLEADAQDLKDATVHWLRHTGISDDVQTRPREHVRDDAGHATMATTDRYVESDRRERHYSAKKKPIKLFE